MNYRVLFLALVCLLFAFALRPARAQDPPGNALAFVGETSEYVDLGAGGSLVLGTNFTQELWLYPPSGVNAVFASVVGGDAGSATRRAPCVFVHESRKIHFGFGNGSTWLDNTTAGLILNADCWNHLAVTFDGTRYVLYVNGEHKETWLLDAQGTPFAGQTPYPTPVDRIGGGLFQWLEGKVDELCLWNRTLTQDEIRDHMHRERAGSETDLVAYYAFNESAGAVLPDLTPNGNNGTLRNMEAEDWTPSGAAIGNTIAQAQTNVRAVWRSGTNAPHKAVSAGLRLTASVSDSRCAVFGHNGVSGATGDDAPAGENEHFQRLGRIWYVHTSADVDADVTVDISTAEGPLCWDVEPVSRYVLLKRSGATGAFSAYATGTVRTNLVVSFPNVTFNGNAYYTLGLRNAPTRADAGPGGLGTADGSSDLELWMRADRGVVKDDDRRVAQWVDLSGNDNSAEQTSGPNRPTWWRGDVLCNQQPSLTFVTGDPWMALPDNILDSGLAYSIYLVGGIMSTNWLTFLAFDNGGGHGSEPWLGTLERKMMYYKASGTGSFTPVGSTDLTTDSYRVMTWLKDASPALQVKVDGAPDAVLALVAGDNAVADACYLGRAASDPYNWQGNMNEVILFSSLLSTAEQVIVENYLGARYDLPVAVDRYAGDGAAQGDYDYDVSGIGAEADGESALGVSEGLLIETNETLAAGDYILGGHNNGGETTTGGLPDGVSSRWGRVWYLDNTGGRGAALTFDFSDAGNGAAENDAHNYCLLYSADGAQFHPLGRTPAGRSGDRVRFDVTGGDLADGCYTLGEKEATGTPPDNALAFDGDGDYVTLGDAVEALDAATFEAWVRLDALPGGMADICSKEYVSQFGIDSEGRLVFAIGNGKGWDTPLRSDSALATGEWHHVAAAWRDTDKAISLYVDGSLDQTGVGSFSMGASAFDRGIGGRRTAAGWTHPFSGRIDEMRIWSVKRVDADIADNAHKYADGDETDLLVYYRFDHDSGSNVIDRTINNFHGSLSGDMTSGDWVASHAAIGNSTAQAQTQCRAVWSGLPQAQTSHGLSASSLIAGSDYAVFGHNGSTGTTGADAPGGEYGQFQRLARTWYVDESGVIDATLTFNPGDAGGALLAGEAAWRYVLLYRSGGSGSFTVLDVGASVDGDAVTFAPRALQDGYYTLGSRGAPVVHYVSQSGLPSPPYTNWASAAATVQDAIDEAARFPGDIVTVTNGVYSKGGRKRFGYGLVNRIIVTSRVAVRSVNGPAVTFIAGAWSKGGNGPEAARCALVMGDGTLEGFTLTNGHTLASGVPAHELSGGGVFVDGAGVVSDCVMANCSAELAGGGAILHEGGLVSRCTVRNNAARDAAGISFWQGGRAENCLVHGNTASADGGGIYCYGRGEVVQATISDNRAGGRGGGAFCSDGGALVNSVLYFNTAGEGRNYWNSGGGMRYAYTCTYPIVGLPGAVGCIADDPAFAGRASSNYRLRAWSPCIDAGHNDDAAGDIDLDGNERIYHGIVDMGAYEGTNINPTAMADTVTLAEDASVTINVVTNDSDPDDTVLTITNVSAAAHGDAVIGAGATNVLYTPSTNYNGGDAFTYWITDGRGGTDSADVTITVEPRNDAPVNTTPPSVTGVHHVGETLMADDGVWNDRIDTNVSGTSTITLTRQWWRADDAGGSGAAAIAGATDANYTLVVADNGRFVRVAVTATDDGVGEPSMASNRLATTWTEVTNSAPALAVNRGLRLCQKDSATITSNELRVVDADDDAAALLFTVETNVTHGSLLLDGAPLGVAGTFTQADIDQERLAYTNAGDGVTLDEVAFSVSDGLGGSIATTAFVFRVCPYIGIANTGVIEGDAGTTAAVFVVTLSGAYDLEARVLYDTQAHTASEGTDYLAAAGTASVVSAGLSTSVTVTVNGDLLDEYDETFAVVLGAPSNAVWAAGGRTGVCTIADNDPVPTATLATGTLVVAENTGSVSVAAGIDVPSGRDIEIPFTVGGTASRPADHNLVDGVFSIAEGTQEDSVMFDIVDDGAVEFTETIVITLASNTLTHAALGDPGVETIEIEEEDVEPDHIPDDWEEANGLSTATINTTTDTDLDGHTDLEEYIAGTVPTNGESVLRVLFTGRVSEVGAVLMWPSASNRAYGVDRSTNLLVGYGELTNDIPATPPVNTFTDAVHAVRSGTFYRVRAELAP